MIIYLILALYLGITFIGSLISTRGSQNTPEDYFLASRSMGTIVLFFTLAATTFSAFFFLGFAGEGYRIGYSYYAMMAFGTSFAALSFYFIGYKVWKLGKAKGYITPVELIEGESKSPFLKVIYLLVMVIFTFPYLAIQPIGAGYILEELTGGQIPYFQGTVLLTLFIIVYVFIGGMKSVAVTDVKQGFIMFSLMALAAIWIAQSLGGVEAANSAAINLKPELFNREGAGGYFTEKKWFSLTLLWVFCLPVLPPTFMRFFISRNLPALKKSSLLFALLPSIIFIFPVSIGVWGHLSFPDLIGAEADQILPKMLLTHTPEWFAALILTGALAAFMSTLDSQLLALSTIFTRDVYTAWFNPKASLSKQVWVGKIMVIGFAAIGLWIASSPPASIFALATVGFTGISALFPATVYVLHKQNANGIAAAISILTGELMMILLYTDVIPKIFIFDFEPVIGVVVFSSLALVILHYLIPKQVHTDGSHK